MAIVRIEAGEPRMAWYWGAALWLPTGGVVAALVLVPFMLWALAQPLGTVLAGLVIGVGAVAFQASLLVWWLSLRRLLRVAQDAEPGVATNGGAR